VPKQSVNMDYLISSEPLELEYLYTVLSQKHSVFFLEKARVKSLYKMIVSNQISMLCISCYMSHTPFVLSLVQQLKNDFPSLYIALGGVYAEVVPEHFFSPSIDVVVFGNHLSAISIIADSLASQTPLKKVKGAAFKDTNFQIEPTNSDFQHAPIPERVLFVKNPERYYYMYFKACATLKTAAGCPEKCSFCFCRIMNNGLYNVRPIISVVDEIEGLATDNIFIVDDNFLTSEKRLEIFCDELEKRNIKKNFIVYGTAHFIATHPELMARLQKNGLAALIVGFEYITNIDLQAVNKGASLADNDTTITLCQQLDIELFALFICDTAWHHRNFRQLAQYIRKKKIRFATFSTPTIFPKTDVAMEQNIVFDVKLLWRYDLLRLHSRPIHISVASYYTWLFYLYLIPTLSFSSLRHFIMRYGFLRAIGILVKSSTFGIIYFFKLIIWK